MSARICTLSLLAPVLVAMSTSALARDKQPGQTFSVPVSVTVNAAGFDLSTPSGAVRLHRQIVAAAEGACRESPPGYKGVTRRKYETQHVRPCVEGAVRAALEQVAAVTGRDLEQVAGLGRSSDRIAGSR